MKYSIVIPCYNEEENLPDLVKAISDFSKDRDMEFVLVENGSKDNSYNLMKNLIADNKKVSIVKIDVNQGYGYGLYQGVKAAKGAYIGWIHADLQLPLSYVVQFLDYLDNYNDSNKLFLKGIRHNRSIADYLFTYGQGLFDSLLFGMWLFDIAAIPTFFHRSLLEKMNNVPNDFSIEIYMYVLAKTFGLKVKRFPIILNKREKGKSSWNTGFFSKIKQSLRIIKASINIKKSGI